MNAEAYGLGRALGILLFIVGGALAVVAGAWVSARLRGRNPRADAAMQAEPTCSPAVFLALIFGWPAESQPDFPQFARLRDRVSQGVRRGFGSAADNITVPPSGRARSRLAAAAVLAGLLMFVFSYFLAGGNLLVMYGIVSMKWKVPVGLVSSGSSARCCPG